MRRSGAFFLGLMLLITSCSDKVGDALIHSDGSLFTGKLQSISGGSLVFDHGTVEVPGEARIWTVSGETSVGTPSYDGRLYTVGGLTTPPESVLVILWNDQRLREGTFEVEATGDWTDTGIGITSGDILAIRAEGTVLTETGLSDPDGQKEFSSAVAVFPGALSGQLIYRIGEGAEPVAAGSLWVGETESSGTLHLAVNIPLEGSTSPSGVYTVNVRAGQGPGNSETVVLYPAE